jgi:hypothetical protein
MGILYNTNKGNRMNIVDECYVHRETINIPKLKRKGRVAADIVFDLVVQHETIQMAPRFPYFPVNTA